MNKRIFLALVLAALALGLCACSIRSPEELYALPKQAAEYNDLQKRIDEITAPGGVYPGGADQINPTGGANTQVVQRQDLDGDGVQEAIAFFRAVGEEQQLKIYIFRQAGESYEVAAVIEGDGTAIDSIAYENLNDSPSKELVVSWQLSATVHDLMVYSFHSGQAEKLMESTGYTRYRLVDVDRDNLREILVIQMSMEDGKSRVECYQSQEDSLAMACSAPISQYATSVAATPQVGYLRGEADMPVPALFVTFNFGERSYVTDLFAWRDGALVNITLNPEHSYSVSTFREDSSGVMLPRDINGDGLTEIPMPETFAAYAAPGARFYSWRQFDLGGTAQAVYTAYHGEEGWYFILPDRWEGQIEVSAKENPVLGERQVVFSYQGPGLLENGLPVDSKTFLTIYKLTGAGRQRRANQAGRFILAEEDDVIYAAELLPDVWDCGLTPEDVCEHFKLVTASYSGEV